MEDLGIADANDLNESIEEIKMAARKWEAKAKKLAPLEVMDSGWYKHPFDN